MRGDERVSAALDLATGATDGSGKTAMRRSIVLILLAIATPALAFLEVPGTYPTIQEAIDAAGEGEVVLVAPGIYTESVRIAGKAIVLASHQLTTGDPTFIEETVIDGGGGRYAVEIADSVGPGTAIQGLTIRNAHDGVKASGRFDLLSSRVTASRDGIDYEQGSGGLVRHCRLEGNADDGIDLDDEVAVIIEENAVRGNGDDGIEVRLHDYTGPELAIVIRDNLISGNGGDGIQLIGDEAPSSRVFHIERNLFLNNAMAGIGMMCCMDSREDFQGARLAERIYLYHNTFVGNDHGVTGGDNVIALNNIFAGTARVALKHLRGRSIAAHNLFFANGTDFVESNADRSTSIGADPLLDADHRPSRRSPAIDAGTAYFEWNSEVVLNRGPGQYGGFAPDLGAFEPAARRGIARQPSCGLGAELPLLLAPLIGLARRRRLLVDPIQLGAAGGPPGTRTPNQWVKSPLLYH